MRVLLQHALKEWASVISALGSGDQIILLRKGGIAERTFGIKADRFLLAPTYLHQSENQFRQSFVHHLSESSQPDATDAVEFRVWCEVVKRWELRDPTMIGLLADEVIFTEETIRARFEFRPDQALQVVAVKSFVLPAPIRMANDRRFLGCRSWVSLDQDIEVPPGHAVLADEILASRIESLKLRLSTPTR